VGCGGFGRGMGCGERFGKLDGMTGVLVGDLLYGRTVHSLIKEFSLFKNTTLYLLSPKNLRVNPELIKKYKKNVNLIEISTVEELPKKSSFWYWTRVQKERFKDIKDYEAVKDSFLLTKDLLKRKGNKDMLVMHPLPRVNELDPAIDSDPRAVYLTKQIKNGMFVRMALLGLVLGKL
jgi:aspartate carbamoyltransferase catalytic subunit